MRDEKIKEFFKTLRLIVKELKELLKEIIALVGVYEFLKFILTK